MKSQPKFASVAVVAVWVLVTCFSLTLVLVESLYDAVVKPQRRSKNPQKSTIHNRHRTSLISVRRSFVDSVLGVLLVSTVILAHPPQNFRFGARR